MLLRQAAGRVLQGIQGVQEGVQGLRRHRHATHSRGAGAAGLRAQGGPREEEEQRQREGQFRHGDGTGRGWTRYQSLFCLSFCNENFLPKISRQIKWKDLKTSISRSIADGKGEHGADKRQGRGGNQAHSRREGVEFELIFVQLVRL